MKKDASITPLPLNDHTHTRTSIGMPHYRLLVTGVIDAHADVAMETVQQQ